ncbi:3H domain-containing protein [Enterococcus sp. LJL99]
MDGNERRQEILHCLEKTEKPISASYFAKLFGVSRQIVVGDVALLRASGHGIVATARGYLYQEEAVQGMVTQIACQHTLAQTEEELLLIISLGGEVLDVIVEHPLYGELKGNLRLKTKKDVTNFIENYKKNNASLLSMLTEGIHLHTIRCQNEEKLLAIKKALAEKGLLYKNS